MVLIAGLVLVAALSIFLTLGRWRSPFNRRDLPKKLGVDIQQEANGFTHAEFHAGHALFKITASRVEQLKDNRFRLHTARIEMYGPDGGTDRIVGSEFEYDQQAGIAQAAGPVEITLDRPPGAQPPAGKKNPSRNESSASSDHPAQPAPSRQIHVRTVGLTFNQNSGVASAANHVDFDLPQASGSAMHATYDSARGQLVLAGDVELKVQRGPESVNIQARRAEFDRDSDTCSLATAAARFRQTDARAEQALILFRDDGSAQQLNATKGLVLTTAGGGRVSAPTGSMRFDEENQPISGRLKDGVVLDSNQNGRTLHGTSPTADLQFSSAGLLQRVHLERGVYFASDERAAKAGVSTLSEREWKSPVADLDFRVVGAGRVGLASVHGIGGVIVTSESQRDKAAPVRARMTADDMTGQFGAKSALTSMSGSGHAVLDQTTATGMHQTSSGDRVEAHFAQPDLQAASGPAGSAGTLQIDQASVVGHVVLTQQPAAQPGTPTAPALRATAQRADYDGNGQWLHLTGEPHVENGEIALDADKIDIARASGDAFAHGTVKATWFGDQTGNQAPALGAQGPAHVVANEAQLHQASGEATFRGQARLWQAADSISAPAIVLDRMKRTLAAHTSSRTDPVRVVLVGSAGAGQGKRSSTPTVIRVRGGDLKYSDAERKAVIQGGILGSVVAETADAVTRSREVELIFLPAGNHAVKEGATSQVDRMTARGDVSILSEGRQGTGEKLEYTSESGEYVLTGTAANPPRMTDPARGRVTGESLIFNSRDDSVNVEGGQHATTTETTAPKRP